MQPSLFRSTRHGVPRTDNNPRSQNDINHPVAVAEHPFGGRRGQRRNVNSSRSSYRHGHADAQVDLRTQLITVALGAPDPGQRAEVHDGNGFRSRQQRRSDQHEQSSRCRRPGASRVRYSANSTARGARSPRRSLRMRNSAYPAGTLVVWDSVGLVLLAHQARQAIDKPRLRTVPQPKQPISRSKPAIAERLSHPKRHSHPTVVGPCRLNHGMDLERPASQGAGPF